VVSEVTFEEILAQFEEAKAALAVRDEMIARQAARIAVLEKALFGAKSEKNVVPPPPATPQLDVFGEQGEATEAEIWEESKEPEKK
jgi:hypothetical protein